MSTGEKISGVILDMDGTLMRGSMPLPGLPELFAVLRAIRMPFVIATNNATKSGADYQHKLAACGVQVPAQKILTAAAATAEFLGQELPPGAKVYMIGRPALHEALSGAGFCLVDGVADGVTAVVAGGDPFLTYEKLKNAALLLQNGARLIGTNPDLLYPTEEGMVPETGMTLAALQAATGVAPTVVGKPARHLFDAAVGRLGCPRGETAVVGDRLETDIRGGQLAGLHTILITTGVDNAESIPAKGIVPDWIVDDLFELALFLRKGKLRKGK
jgi:4-nitrophenyl phosphatase